MNENRLSVNHSFRRAFAHALAWVIVGWVVATFIMILLVRAVSSPVLLDSIVIAIASLVIASVSMLPGFLGGAQGEGIGAQGEGMIVRLMAGILIRLAGTVALFLTCRYHMASPMEMIAAMTISWYVLLTSIEVTVLVLQSPRVAPPRPESFGFPAKTQT